MYHSITFIGEPFSNKNTFSDWFLAPTSRPSFVPPAVRTNFLDIPGRDGLLDVSRSLTGYPTYTNRTGSIEFLLLPDGSYTWNETYSMVANWLHGQSRKAFLEDDPAYLYEGLWKVNNFKSGEKYSTIVIDYDLQPYKKSRWTTIDEWEWDPFNFSNGVILKDYYTNLQFSSNDEYSLIFSSSFFDERFRQSAIGRLVTCPTLHVTSENPIHINFVNSELNIDRTDLEVQPGDHKIPEIIFSMQHPDNTVSLSAKGVGSLSIEFYIGSL